MNIGDRVKFKTMGGWYNSGIIKDMDEDSYPIEVDKLGYKLPENAFIALPYHVRVLSCGVESEVEKMNKQEAIDIKDEILRKEGTVYIGKDIKLDGLVLITDVLDIINKHTAESEGKNKNESS